MNKLIRTHLGIRLTGKAPLLLTLMAGLAVEAVAESSFTRITDGSIATDVPQSYQGVWNDFDGDGFLDLYVLSWNSANFFYRNNGDGTFTGSTHASAGGFTITSSWADYDSDGAVDFVVCNANAANPLFVNDGSGNFTIVNAPPLTTDAANVGGSGAWADYDGDGYLDFFVSGATQAGFGPGSNFLYHNIGNGDFERVTTGPIVTDQLSSRFSAWGDFDDDGDLDLYVISGAHRNALYWNDGVGNFTAEPPGSAVISDVNNTFGFAWGDYDNDGLLDLFVPHWNDGDHSLYHNDGNGEFSRVTGVGIGTGDASAHGASWADYDNDGWLDLFVARGASTAQTSPVNANNLLYRNNGDGTFTQVTEGSPVNDGGDSASGAWGDYDNDGFLDLFVANRGNFGAPNFLYHNDGNENGWIKIRCVGRSSNRSAIGAKIRLKARIGGKEFWQLRTIPDGTAATGAPLEAMFGLGDATIVETIRVEWPSDIVQELNDVAIKRTLEITEPARLTTKEQGKIESRNWNGLGFYIQESEDLVSWTLLGDFSDRDGWFVAEDPNAATLPKRFYRAASQPAGTADIFITAGVTIDANGGTVVPVAADPATLLFYRRTELPVLAPDGHHVTAGEFAAAQGTAEATCTGAGTKVEIHLTGLIPNALYRVWVLTFQEPGFDLGPPPDFSNVIGEGALGPSDRTGNTFQASASGEGTITGVVPEGAFSEFGEASGCLLTDVFDWHIVGAFQQPDQPAGPDVGPPALFPGTAVEQFVFFFNRKIAGE